MGWKKNPQSSWNLLRENNRLRGLLQYQLDQAGLSYRDVGDDLGIAQWSVMRYFTGQTPNITNMQILAICEYLGVEVGLDVKILPSLSLKAIKKISSNASSSTHVSDSSPFGHD